jgi:hypothetical protein
MGMGERELSFSSRSLGCALLMHRTRLTDRLFFDPISVAIVVLMQSGLEVSSWQQVVRVFR